MTDQPESKQPVPDDANPDEQSGDQDPTQASHDLSAVAREALRRLHRSAIEEEAASDDDTGTVDAVAPAEDVGDTTNDLQQEALKAQALAAEQAREAAKAREESKAPPPPATPFTEQMFLILDVVENGQQIKRVVEEELVVGRADKATDYAPAIDMTPHGAYRLGLSRRHAIIKREGEGLVVRDLNSRNGTFVNGTIVPGGSTRSFSDGDELRFGNLVVRVRFGTAQT